MPLGQTAFLKIGPGSLDVSNPAEGKAAFDQFGSARIAFPGHHGDKGEFMAATAVGMFENAALAESVAASLRTTVRPPRSVQVFAVGTETSDSADQRRVAQGQVPLTGQRLAAANRDRRNALLCQSAEQSAVLRRDEARTWGSSEPATAVAGDEISEDLRLIGVNEPEIAIYLTGLRRGHAVVLATGTLAQADAASARMNRFDPIEVESRVGFPTGAESDAEGGWIARRESQASVSYPDFGIYFAECARLFCW